MKPKIINEDWYDGLVSDILSIAGEGIWSSRWTLIETYHKIGKRILEENKNFERKKIYGERIIQTIAESVNSDEDENGKKIGRIDTRTLYYAIKFAKKFPCETEELPGVLMPEEGKNLSWTKVIRRELTTPKEKEECKHDNLEQVTICIDCKKVIDGERRAT